MSHKRAKRRRHALPSASRFSQPRQLAAESRLLQQLVLEWFVSRCDAFVQPLLNLSHRTF